MVNTSSLEVRYVIQHMTDDNYYLSNDYKSILRKYSNGQSYLSNIFSYGLSNAALFENKDYLTKAIRYLFSTGKDEATAFILSSRIVKLAFAPVSQYNTIQFLSELEKKNDISYYTDNCLRTTKDFLQRYNTVKESLGDGIVTAIDNNKNFIVIDQQNDSSTTPST